MTRTDIINFLIQKFNFKNYLEIGVQYPQSNFDKIEIESKTGVEPYPITELHDTIIKATSDEFFAELKDNEKWDIIFIDGLHTREQCLADILNSLKHLSPNGTILVHDCLPTAEYQTTHEDNGREWTGDVWKSIVDIKEKNGLDVSTIDTDWGIGCIRLNVDNVGFENPIELDWENYELLKHELLNIKSIDQWIKSL